MITAAGIVLLQANGFATVNLLVTGATIALLATRRIPAPLLVGLALLAGVFLRP